MHLNKYIALNTNYSRRQAEKLIREGAVKLNKNIAQLGQIVGPKDKVCVNNNLLNNLNEKLIVIMLNKPLDYVCTKKRFNNEKNIYQLLPKKYQSLNIIGRLDKNSQGLLLLSNSGNLINQLSHPRYGHRKDYKLKLKRDLDKKEIEEIRKGIKDNGEILKVKSINKENNYYLITLTEGKNHQLRRIFKALKITLISLERVSINNLHLSNLKLGEYKELNRSELKDLYFSEKWLK